MHVLSLISIRCPACSSCSHCVLRLGLSAASRLPSTQRLRALVPAELKVHVFKSNLQNRTMYQGIRKAIACINCRSSPRAISTGQLHTLLHFHLRPINQIVFLGPYSIKDERSHLRGSFTLRCFQRLSRPYIATQLCPWQDNWCTRGTSIPVLSY